MEGGWWMMGRKKPNEKKPDKNKPDENDETIQPTRLLEIEINSLINEEKPQTSLQR